VVSSLTDTDGSAAPHTNNKLILVLTNIQKETITARSPMANAGFGERVAASTQPLHINLNVMLAANFGSSNYAEALKFISKAISYFQIHPVFDRQSSPDMDSRIEKMILDIENLNIQDLSNIWGILGGKYLPSINYRVRMISISPDNVIAQMPVASRPKTDVR
jgi:Pvc16 N-terminal domain